MNNFVKSTFYFKEKEMGIVKILKGGGFYVMGENCNVGNFFLRG